MYADKHYFALKLLQGYHLRKLLHGIEECHQHNAGQLRFRELQLKWTCYRRLWPLRPLCQLCGQCDAQQGEGNCTVHQGTSRLSFVLKTNRDSSLKTTFCQSVAFYIVWAWHHSRRSCLCSGVKGRAQKGAWISVFLLQST